MLGITNQKYYENGYLLTEHYLQLATNSADLNTQKTPITRKSCASLKELHINSPPPSQDTALPVNTSTKKKSILIF